jgi:hypothetical protein
MTTREMITATVNEYALLERAALAVEDYFLAEYYYNLRMEVIKEQIHICD